MAFDQTKSAREFDSLADALTAASAEMGVNLHSALTTIEIDDDEFQHLLEDAAKGEPGEY